MDSSKLPITGPCPIDLDAIGFDRSAKNAHCTHCVKSVHNLSNMTATEARTFLKENAGEKVCVSYARQKDGMIRFKSEETVVPLSRLRSRRPAAAAAAIGFAAALAACTPVDNADVPRPTIEETDKPTPKHEEMVAGEMMPDPTPRQDEIVEGGLKLPPDPEPIEEVAGEIEAIDPEPIEELAGEIEAVDPEPETQLALGRTVVASPPEAPCFGEAKLPEADPPKPPPAEPGKAAPRGLDPL